MAKDYNQILLDRGYSQEQINAMRGVANSGGTNQQIVNAGGTPTNTPKTSTPTPKDTSWDQGNGNYVYNPNTGYYEKEGTARATQSTPSIIETPKKKEETPISTDTEIKKQGELAPLSQEYYNQTNDVALNQIRDNLNRYRQSNPEYFTTYEDFQKNFSYDMRNDEQKNVLDTWYKGYQEGLTLSGTPTSELYTQYKDGSLSAGQLEQLRISDPTKYAELQEQINKGNIISAYDDDKGMDVSGNSIQDMAYQAAQQMFLQWMNGGDSGASQFFSEYRANMDSPEMVELADKTTEIQERMENLQDDIASLTKSIEKEYEGTGASRSKISAIVADRTYDLQLQLRTLNSEYNKYATQYNNRMQQYQNEFQLQLQEYQINQQARQQQMQELGFAMDLMSFETPQQAQEREWNYWVMQQEYQNGNINSKDYNTRYKAALNSVQNLLSQYEGIPMVRSAEEMAQDILTAIDGGSNLGAELTKINKQIQQKPEYKMVYNATFKSGSGTGSFIQDRMKIGDTEWVKYNGQRFTADSLNEYLKGGGQGSAKPYDTVDESVFSLDIRATNNGDTVGKTLGKFLMQKANGMKGGQCGKYVNDYLQYIGVTGAANRYYDDELSTKLNSVNTYNPKVGTVAVFDYNHKSSDGINHGHVGIVTKVYSDGSFDVRDSNYGKDEKVQTRHITNGDSALKGFFDPSKPQISYTSEVEETTTPTYNTEEVGLYNNYLQNGAMPTDAKLKAIGGGDLAKGIEIFNSKAKAYQEATGVGTVGKAVTTELTSLRKEFNQQQIVKDYNDMKNSYSKLLASNNGTAAGDLSLIFAYMKLLDPGSVVREGEFANASNAGGIDKKIRNLYNKVVDGTMLTQEQRNDFINAAGSILDGYTENYNQLLEQYQSYITQGGDPEQIGKRGTFVTDSYKQRYGQTGTTGYAGTSDTQGGKWYDDVDMDNALKAVRLKFDLH